MKPVPVTELKARLSRYLRLVKRGGEVQITERGVPVARLVGVGCAVQDDDLRQRLVRAGVLRAGSGDASWILDEEPVRAGGSLSAALDEVRGDRF